MGPVKATQGLVLTFIYSVAINCGFAACNMASHCIDPIVLELTKLNQYALKTGVFNAANACANKLTSDDFVVFVCVCVCVSSLFNHHIYHMRPVSQSHIQLLHLPSPDSMERLRHDVHCACSMRSGSHVGATLDSG